MSVARSPANRPGGWGWGWTPISGKSAGMPRTPIPIRPGPRTIRGRDGDGDRGFRALWQTARDSESARGHGSGPSRSSPHFPSRAESESRSAPPHWQAAGPRLGRSLWGQAMQPQAEGVLKRAFCMAYWQDLAEKGTRVGLGARPHSGTSKVTSLVSPRSTLRL